MPHIEIAAETLFFVGDMPITNALLTSWIVVGLLVLAALWVSRRLRLVPAGLQNVSELILERFLGIMESPFGSRAKAERYLPIVATIFTFVLLSNWLGILPGIGSVGVYERSNAATNGEPRFIPLLRSAASDLNFTLAIAIAAVVLVNLSGILAIGAAKHFRKFFTIKSPLDGFVGMLEFISELAKMVSFSFRLFGNVFAGEVLLVITAFLAPYIIPIPFLGLELFVGFIQALVFAMLTMIFISMAVEEYR